MNEQIEHIAKVIHDSDIADINTFPISMSECLARHGARRTGAAMALFKAGYRKQSEWISVTERLPEKDGRYLVYDGDTGNYYDSYYDETERQFGEWQDRFDPFTLGVIDCEWNSCPNVTHWMPLPEPPKMKGGAE